MIIKLSNDIMQKVNANTIKAVEMVTYILNNVPETVTKKPITETALKDISFSGIYPKTARIDTWTNEIIINF